jgi:hypothetical protein
VSLEREAQAQPGNDWKNPYPEHWCGSDLNIFYIDGFKLDSSVAVIPVNASKALTSCKPTILNLHIIYSS